MVQKEIVIKLEKPQITNYNNYFNVYTYSGKTFNINQFKEELYHEYQSSNYICDNFYEYILLIFFVA